MKNYLKNGFAKIDSLFSLDELNPIRDTISRIIYLQSKKDNLEYCLTDLSPQQFPHEGLMRISNENKESVRQIVDKIMANALVLNFTTQIKLLNIIKKYVFAQNIEDICLTDFHVRVDLPSKFNDEERKFSLPWHQESNYFHKAVAKSSSIVVWIPLYKCNKDDGCLEVLPESHAMGILKHEEKYMLPKEKKHLRTFIDNKSLDTTSSIFAQANEGDIYINHFNLVHKTGKNINNKVRYTLLVRASNINADDFII